jgi:hypothetical protein
MAARPLYRFLLIAGLVVLAGILGGFIGTYPLFKQLTRMEVGCMFGWVLPSSRQSLSCTSTIHAKKRRTKQLLALVHQCKQIIQKWKHVGKTLATIKM